jgi:hypothetical protein
MMRPWLAHEGTIRSLPRSRALACLALILGGLLFASTTGWVVPDVRPHLAAQRYVMPLVDGGQLDYPRNFGYRCTLVDAATVLDYYGAQMSQSLLALRLSGTTGYSDAAQGVPWWAYVGRPGQRPLLDSGIERVANEVGLRVRAQTVPGLDFARAASAIARNQPLILNMWRAPDGTYNHSLLAYGYDARPGHALLLVVDPNSQASYWIGPKTHWSQTITTTYIAPGPPRGTP